VELCAAKVVGDGDPSHGAFQMLQFHCLSMPHSISTVYNILSHPDGPVNGSDSCEPCLHQKPGEEGIKRVQLFTFCSTRPIFIL